jgi:hypothetical protein
MVFKWAIFAWTAIADTSVDPILMTWQVEQK